MALVCLSNISSSEFYIERELIVVNGAYPGPTIEANWGDWIEVNVYNNLNEGTSIHWHGLLQHATVFPPQFPILCLS